MLQNCPHHVPQWLMPILGAHDREIICHPQARFLQVDQDDNRLPRHQQWIESPVGSMWVDARQKKIIGYGPAVQPLPHMARALN